MTGNYIVIKVDYITNNKFDSIVKPWLPIYDLVPAISVDSTDGIEKITIEKQKKLSDGTQFSDITKQCIKIYLHRLLKQCIKDLSENAGE